MPTPPPPVDWDAIHDEALQLLGEYLRIDTTNPPGNEYLACDWLEGLLAAEGFACERFDPGEGRHSLRAVYAGDGSKRPVILLNHTDVVPAEAERWEQPPFSGAVVDGVIWGRGALDMKGLAVIQLLTLLLFKRHGIASKRDLVFLATLDCRLLPGTRPEDFRAALERVIDDPRVQVEVELQRYSPPSPNDNEVFRIYQQVVRESVEDALFTPMMEVGFTDSVTFRNLGIEAYGFCPAFLTLEELATAHGHNERLSVESLRMGCRLYFETVRRLCVE